MSNREEIDEIMEEMEAATPKNLDKIERFNGFSEQSSIPDDVDAKSVPSGSEIFKSILKPQKPGLIHPSRPTNERYYDFTNSYVGVALIFNQSKFKGDDERKGSNKDTEDLRKVLSDIGFAVEICDNYSTRKIHEVLNECNCVEY
jgi:hypothetical protein